MGISNVSTYTVLQQTLNNVSKIEGDLTNEQQQLSSGNKSQDFTGIATQTQQFLSLDSVIAKTDQYLNDNQLIETRINATSSVLDQIVTSATNLGNLIAQRRSGVANSSAFGNQVQGFWQEIVGQLNTSVNNQYLFGGTKTNTPPVDATNFPSPQTPGVPDDGYYHGSQQDIFVTAQDNTSIKYNVRADASAFQKIFAGIAMAQKGDQGQSDTDLQQAYSLVQSGLQDVINIQATVNSNKVQFTNIDKSLQNNKLYWQGIQQTIGNTDILSVSTQVATNQGILQAAFQAFAKISGLRLSDYLK